MLNDIGYELIKNKQYKLAQRILEFAINMPRVCTD
jgi:hypothetical protein